MTWHAAKFLLLNAALLATAAFGCFAFATARHRGHEWLRRWTRRFCGSSALGNLRSPALHQPRAVARVSRDRDRRATAGYVLAHIQRGFTLERPGTASGSIRHRDDVLRSRHSSRSGFPANRRVGGRRPQRSQPAGSRRRPASACSVPAVDFAVADRPRTGGSGPV
jgi:hypothetical protein